MKNRLLLFFMLIALVGSAYGLLEPTEESEKLIQQATKLINRKGSKKDNAQQYTRIRADLSEFRNYKNIDKTRRSLENWYKSLPEG